MAPTDINLGQTHRWLAQLHTTNLPPSTSSGSSMHSSAGSSADYGCTFAASSPFSTSPTSSSSSSGPSPATAVPPSPLSETRARSLQRLCEIGAAHASANTATAAESAGTVPHPAGITTRFGPSNINYIKAGSSGSWSAAGDNDSAASSPLDASPIRGRSRWSRKSSGQSLEAVEGASMRCFSLSKFKLR